MKEMIRFKRLFAVLLIVLGLTANAQEKPVFLNHTKQAWVDSVFNSMTPDERMAQLFMVAAYSNKDEAPTGVNN